MQISFWQQRWDENQIGFHLPEVNPYLTQFWSQFDSAGQGRVFVPLCGKSLDMIWLAQQGHRVLGVECSDKALQAFFEEQHLDVTHSEYRGFQRHQSGSIEVLEGDFFSLDSDILSDVEIVYDRASLVALPEEMRQQYAELLKQLLPQNVSILLVTVDYDQSAMSGPPFAVSEEEVRALFADAFRIERLHQQDMLESSPRFRDRGLEYMQETIYKIQR